MLKCGCNAMGQHNNKHDGLEAGHPTCIVHDCCDVVDAPDLKGRKARCGNYGRATYKNECDDCVHVCQHERKSSVDLAFFSHKPNEEYDEFYCGCHGWD